MPMVFHRTTTSQIGGPERIKTTKYTTVIQNMFWDVKSIFYTINKDESVQFMFSLVDFSLVHAILHCTAHIADVS